MVVALWPSFRCRPLAVVVVGALRETAADTLFPAGLLVLGTLTPTDCATAVRTLGKCPSGEEMEVCLSHGSGNVSASLARRRGCAAEGCACGKHDWAGCVQKET